MKYKIAQIIPYFGKWPEWIELYFYSCGKNPMVDFIFYTDCDLPKHQYDNTIFHRCSFEEYVGFVSKRLNLDKQIQRPYKLTDLKPFLGYVHQEDLKGYDFWSFGDLDLVYGDLSTIVNDRMLERYDVITSHSNRIAGHFALIRNNDYYRNLCFKIDDWKDKLVDDKHYGLDEHAWTSLVNPILKNVDRLYRYIFCHLGCDRDKVFDFFNRMLTGRLYSQELYTTPYPQPEFNNSETPQWQYDVRTNTIYDPKGRILPYLHFMAFKKCQYVDTDVYWRESFWQIDNDFDKYRVINFDCNKVTGIE